MLLSPWGSPFWGIFIVLIYVDSSIQRYKIGSSIANKTKGERHQVSLQMNEYESMEVKVRTGIVFLFKMHQTPCLRALYSHFLLNELDVQNVVIPGLEGEFII